MLDRDGRNAFFVNGRDGRAVAPVEPVAAADSQVCSKVRRDTVAARRFLTNAIRDHAQTCEVVTDRRQPWRKRSVTGRVAQHGPVRQQSCRSRLRQVKRLRRDISSHLPVVRGRWPVVQARVVGGMCRFVGWRCVLRRRGRRRRWRRVFRRCARVVALSPEWHASAEPSSRGRMPAGVDPHRPLADRLERARRRSTDDRAAACVCAFEMWCSYIGASEP